jgi:anti-sigma factor RsiW
MKGSEVMSDQVSCQTIVELVTAYLEDDLPASERDRFERHLTVCPGCVEYLAQIRVTARLSGQRLREDTLDPEYRHELLGVFRRWQNDPRG